MVIAFIFNGRKRDNLHEVIRFKFHIQERLRFHSLKGNKNRHDIVKKSPTPPPTHQTFSPPHTLFQTRGLLSGPHLTEIKDRQCCLLFGKGARLVDVEPQSWWGRAHILLRAQSHLPGRVTREVCLPVRGAGGILWAWSRVEVLPSYFSPTLVGGVDPTAPPSPFSQTFNRPFRPPEQWRVFRSTFSACDLQFF